MSPILEVPAAPVDVQVQGHYPCSGFHPCDAARLRGVVLCLDARSTKPKYTMAGLNADDRVAIQDSFGFQAPNTASALKAVSNMYDQFLLDPRAAIRPRAVPVRLSEFINRLEKAVGGDQQALVRLIAVLASNVHLYTRVHA